MTVLALRDDQTQWLPDQVAALRQLGIDEDVTEAELQVFLHECQRRKLDPFTRQIYLIGRWDKRKKRKVYRSQTGIDGFRVIARRAADKSGIDYSYEDTTWFDGTGKRHEAWGSPQAPAAAKVVIVRGGSRFDAVARYGAYVQTDAEGNPTGQWRTMADVMEAKCAEALALRKAFPEDLGGLYTDDEMAQADNPQTVQATAEVIRDEPAPDTGPPWIDQALEQASALKSEHAGQKLRAEARTRYNNSEITGEEGQHLVDVIEARTADIRRETFQAAMRLLPEDTPWRDKIDELSSASDADQALAELDGLEKAGTVDGRLATRIRRAIVAKSVMEGFPPATEAAA